MLEAFGKARYLGTSPGLAALNDLAMLAGMYGMLGGFVHAAALVRTEGVTVTEFTETLLIPWLQRDVPGAGGHGGPDRQGRLHGTRVRPVHAGGERGIAEVSRTLGVTDLTAPLFALMRRRVEQGHGGDDFPSVIELLS